MLLRVAVGVGGALAALAALPVALIPYAVFAAAINNECLFDGGAPDCWDPGVRALMLAWGVAGLGVVAGVVYVGGAGVYWAFTRHSAPRVGVAAAVTAVLAFLVALPLLVQL